MQHYGSGNKEFPTQKRGQGAASINWSWMHPWATSDCEKQISHLSPGPGIYHNSQLMRSTLPNNNNNKKLNNPALRTEDFFFFFAAFGGCGWRLLPSDILLRGKAYSGEQFLSNYLAHLSFHFLNTKVRPSMPNHYRFLSDWLNLLSSKVLLNLNLIVILQTNLPTLWIYLLSRFLFGGLWWTQGSEPPIFLLILSREA